MPRERAVALGSPGAGAPYRLDGVPPFTTRSGSTRMRALEVLLLLVLALSLARVLWRPAVRGPGLVFGGAVVTGALAAAHVLLEGMRWQLVPAYLVTAALVVVALWRLRRSDAPAGRPGRARAVAGGGLLALVLAAAAGWALPVVALPAPDGSRPVGTTVFELVDADRTEPYSDDRGRHRRIAVQAWYPAQRSGPPAPWASGAAFGARAGQQVGMPGFSLGHLSLLTSHATAQAPIDEAGPYPVVVYSHGWGGFRTAQSDHMEELASRGYVAIAIDHTYGSLATVFPDGDVVPLEPSALPAEAAPRVFDAAAEKLVATFAADIELVLDHLRGAGGEERFDGLLDLSRLALAGHSAGGGAAVLACATEADCDAVVGLDPWVEPVPDAVIGSGLDQPMLSLRSEEWLGTDNDARLRRLHVASPAPARLAHVTGTRHRDFTLLPLLTPLASQLGLSGETDGRRTHRMVDAAVLDFLDRALRGPGDPTPAPIPGGFPELVDEGLVGGDEG